MINKLKEIKELREISKLAAEEELNRLEKDYEILILLVKVRPTGYIFSIDQKCLSDKVFHNRIERLGHRLENIFDDIGIEYHKEFQPEENFKRKINQLEKNLKNLTDVANKFKQRSQGIF